MAGFEAKCGAFFMLSDIKSSSLHDTHKLTTTVLYFEQNHRIDSMIYWTVFKKIVNSVIFWLMNDVLVF